MAALSRSALVVDAEPAAAEPTREFQFSAEDFRFLASVAHRQAGIALSEAKGNLLYGRLSRRLRALGLNSFKDYRALLEDTTSGEVERFINAISTNHTKFFREIHHLEHFRDDVLAPFLRKHPSGGKMRIWSAGCSSGEEPYSLAAIIAREVKDLGKHDIRILATDIDTEILARAARGEYEATALADMPKDYQAVLKGGQGRSSRTFVVPQSLRGMVTYKPLNLMHDWPVRGPFDAIFCRNVMIYFDPPTKARLIERFTDLIAINAWLYIGHSESLIGSYPRLQLHGRTIYRRVK